MTAWRPDSWRTKKTTQRVSYPDEAAVAAVSNQLVQWPPLVTPLEITALKKVLAAATENKAFLLQGGDCAESFADCNAERITNKLRILLQMSLVLVHGMHKPIIRVGRIAGQYAKPRSNAMETRGEQTLPSYRGDLINGISFDPAVRTPNPQRMLQGYHHAALTLNYIRALVDGGFADLHHSDDWQLDFARDSSYAVQYQAIVSNIEDSLAFIDAIGSLPEGLKRVDFFTSHEALHLPYEQALTREHAGKWYDLSTHFPWVGMRTATLDSAHIEYCRGIANPIAIKVGPEMPAQTLRELVELLNPGNEPGRLTLTHRFGCQHIAEQLPPLIETVKSTGIKVLWVSDPMHGNTTTADGYKTRRFDDILSELEQSFSIHQQCDSHLGGVHFELTGEDVTECVGGAGGLTAAGLKRAYHTLVDPRLNYQQALEMSMRIVAHYRNPNQ